MKPQELTRITISDRCFAMPLRKDDVFHSVKYVSGDFDFPALKAQADRKAMNSAARIGRMHKLPKGNNSFQARGTLAKRIFGLLTSSRYRRGSIHYINQDVFIQKINDAISHDNPIELILEFFAFKMRNCLRTFGQDGTEVDLSEAAAILRLHEIACAIRHIYPPGAVVKVATDGTKFHRALETTPEIAAAYSRNIQILSEMMGVRDTVCILDEAEYFTDDYVENTDRWYAQIRNDFFGQSHSDIDLIEAIQKLRNSMHYMLPIPKEVPIEVVSLAFSRQLSDDTLNSRHHEAYHLRRDIQERALDATFKYVAVKKANPQMLDKIAPHALPCCAHPRPGYLGLYIAGRGQTLFPHHSQGTTKSELPSAGIDDIRIRYAADIRRSPECENDSKGLVLPQEKYPFSNGSHPFTFLRRNLMQCEP